MRSLVDVQPENNFLIVVEKEDQCQVTDCIYLKRLPKTTLSGEPKSGVNFTWLVAAVGRRGSYQRIIHAQQIAVVRIYKHK